MIVQKNNTRVTVDSTIKPLIMRHKFVKIAHDATEYCRENIEQTLKNHWFPHTREYEDKFIKYCTPCLYNKQSKIKA